MSGGRRQGDALWLSIVIPAYNEAKRLPPSLKTIVRFLKRRKWYDISEVIVVDDGSVDRTVAVAKRFAAAHPPVKIISAPHRGKGAAIRRGMLEARGDFIFLCDADLAMPIKGLPNFLPPLSPEADLVIGSRELPGAHRYSEPWHRHVMGRVFNLIVKMLVVPGIDDTQCGFKCLTRAAAGELAHEMTLDGLSFDVEMLALARALDMTISEIPVEWHHEPNSRVRPIRDTIAMVCDVWRVRRRMRAFQRIVASNESEPVLTAKSQPLTVE
jgi:dolichyl-phosphate beta-glucosyltransferase